MRLFPIVSILAVAAAVATASCKDKTSTKDGARRGADPSSADTEADPPQAPEAPPEVGTETTTGNERPTARTTRSEDRELLPEEGKPGGAGDDPGGLGGGDGTAGVPLHKLNVATSGACGSPRDALIHFYHWTAEGSTHFEPTRAAQCSEGVAGRAGDLLSRLRKVMEARGVYVSLDTVPDDPSYVDDNGEHRYRLSELSDFVLVRRDGRWIVASETLERVPALYDDAFDE